MLAQRPGIWRIAAYTLEIILMLGFITSVIAFEKYVEDNRKETKNPRRTHIAGIVIVK